MKRTQDGLFPHPRGQQETLPLGGAAVRHEPASPLDVPQNFTPATSYQVRDELQELIRRDLLGPWDGEREVFPPAVMGPRERYLVGMIGPKPGARTTARPGARRG